MESFERLGIPEFMVKTVRELGYTLPTTVQEKTIPKALEGSSIIGLSQTGTGKTAAFLLPIIANLYKGRSKARMPRSLVLCPTRELAAQVMDNFTSYSKNTKLSSALLIGGVSFKDQDKKLDRGVDVIIATPGRLLDHFERGKLVLTGVESLAIDEADKMLDMGFIPDVTKILESLPRVRQKILFSATLSKEIENLIKKFLNDAHRVEVAPSATITETVKQILIFTDNPKSKRLNKAEFLFEILRKDKAVINAIIFCNRKREVSHLANLLKKNNFSAGEIHGDLNQKSRMDVVAGFKGGSIKFLVASDVAARGLDIPNVSHVINYDVPVSPEDYVHRIGRTGRAGNTGIALTLVKDIDMPLIKSIESLIDDKIYNATGEWSSILLKKPLDKDQKKQLSNSLTDKNNSFPNFLFTKFESN